VGWGGSHKAGADVSSSDRNNLELNIVTEQPRKREDEEEEQLEGEEQESSLESQSDLQPHKFHPTEEQSSIEERSSSAAFGFEKNFLRLKRPSADASTEYSEKRHGDDEGAQNEKDSHYQGAGDEEDVHHQEAGDEEDGQDDDNSLDSGFQESNRLQDLETQMKRSSQLSRISFEKADPRSSKSSRVSSSEADQEAEKKSSQSSRLSHVLWSKGSSDTDDEADKETKANTETTKDAEKDKDKSFSSQNGEIEKEVKEDESNSNMEKAEESMMGKGGNREEEISELEASLERLRSERMRRSAEKHEAGPSGVLEEIRRDSTSSTVSSVKQVELLQAAVRHSAAKRSVRDGSGWFCARLWALWKLELASEGAVGHSACILLPCMPCCLIMECLGCGILCRNCPACSCGI